MSSRLTWFKSSYSDAQGSDCIEVALDWRKSTYSDDEGANCVEVAACPDTVHVRDSKLGEAGPRFSVPAGVWGVFLGGVAARCAD
ncbi:toxin [Streptomyces subrutilus]|uniref:DUF397 domain-containing protein n=1 Tax=Streptomyces subrutilus TaxID=36818 RepID=A0A5P2UIG6_9ACTN|nr:DUF397 domain-containing protein [Streptomyces subrutilus]QEU79056.1 DUF397 domain-containing protein [Streptomyces subrutilus]GGZ76866.1 toxin [Streptomyces subrutilus]